MSLKPQLTLRPTDSLALNVTPNFWDNSPEGLSLQVGKRIGALAYGDLDAQPQASEKLLSPEDLSKLFWMQYSWSQFTILGLFFWFLMDNNDILSKTCWEYFVNLYIADFQDCILAVTQRDWVYTRRFLFCLNSFLLSLKRESQGFADDSQEPKSILDTIQR